MWIPFLSGESFTIGFSVVCGSFVAKWGCPALFDEIFCECSRRVVVGVWLMVYCGLVVFDC